MKTFFTLCALCCFIAILKLPITYYTFLRIIISLGAILAIYNFLKHKDHAWLIVFVILLILFNPVFPIYLYRKSAWVPLDILVGILFLLLAFVKKKAPKKTKTMEVLPVAKTYTRDRIISPKKLQ
ncbi:DUF6804 family protein [Pedobacter sp. UC225_65]|uniref:DUF6804 family protein n=1 Tax=Pedobacter sp. UC225_65 TaxID=3350173 RepID=UPI00366E114A